MVLVPFLYVWGKGLLAYASVSLCLSLYLSRVYPRVHPRACPYASLHQPPLFSFFSVYVSLWPPWRNARVTRVSDPNVSQRRDNLAPSLPCV